MYAPLEGKEWNNVTMPATPNEELTLKDTYSQHKYSPIQFHRQGLPVVGENQRYFPSLSASD